MAHTITDTHIDFDAFVSYYVYLDLKPSTTYTTNLMYFNWSTGELAPLSIYCGPRGGYYFQFSDNSRKPYSYSDINVFTVGASVTIFTTSNLSRFLPVFINATNEQISTHSRLLAKHQARLTHLQSLADIHPEAFV